MPFDKVAALPWIVNTHNSILSLSKGQIESIIFHIVQATAAQFTKQLTFKANSMKTTQRAWLHLLFRGGSEMTKKREWNLNFGNDN